MLARVCAAALTLLLPAGAAHSGAQLALSAVVAKTARIAVLGHPANIHVSEADLLRGYLDIGPGPRVDVRTNSRDGLHIVFQASSEPVRAVQLRGEIG